MSSECRRRQQTPASDSVTCPHPLPVCLLCPLLKTLFLHNTSSCVETSHVLLPLPLTTTTCSPWNSPIVLVTGSLLNLNSAIRKQSTVYQQQSCVFVFMFEEGFSIFSRSQLDHVRKCVCSVHPSSFLIYKDNTSHGVRPIVRCGCL